MARHEPCERRVCGLGTSMDLHGGKSPMGGSYFAQGERDGAGLSSPQAGRDLGGAFLTRPSAGSEQCVRTLH